LYWLVAGSKVGVSDRRRITHTPSTTPFFPNFLGE
jgi:hypothetical protein